MIEELSALCRLLVSSLLIFLSTLIGWRPPKYRARFKRPYYTQNQHEAITWLLCCREMQVLPKDLAKHIARYYILPKHYSIHPLCKCRVDFKNLNMHIPELTNPNCPRAKDMLIARDGNIWVYVRGWPVGTLRNYHLFTRCCDTPLLVRGENQWKCCNPNCCKIFSI